MTENEKQSFDDIPLVEITPNLRRPRFAFCETFQMWRDEEAQTVDLYARKKT